MSSEAADPARREAIRNLMRFALGLLLLLVLVGFLMRALRPELESVGQAFVLQFGFAGMALGTFLADGFHFPVPPQAYMLLAVAAGKPDLWTFLSILAGSLLGGACGYMVAGRLAQHPRLARWLARMGRGLEGQLTGRKAYRSAVVASVAPVAFSVQCYLGGLYRLAPRAFLVILLLRIPKLMVFYELVKIGWTGF